MEILAQLLAALEQGEQPWLATIIHVQGSSPAPVLSRMLVSRSGAVLAGTLGGGCTENDVRQAAIDTGPTGRTTTLSLGLSEDHVELGPMCGGTIDVLIEPITRYDAPVFERLKQIVDTGSDALLATGVAEHGEILFRAVVEEAATRHPLLTSLQSDDGLHAADYPEGSGARRESIAGGEVILQPFRGRPEAVVFGGGHVGRSIAHLAAFAGFRVTVVDDRAQYAHPERFPTADRAIALPFERVFASLTVTPSTYLVIVTRGHQHDEAVLRQALQTNAKYIGMIGSQRKIEVTFRHLKDDGVPESSLRKVYTPIGIDIKASTVEEIAVSVVAEMIAIRRGSTNPAIHKRSA